MATIQDFKGDKPTWCPGCGDFTVLAGIQQAAIQLGLEPHQILTVSGIGCSSKMSEYIRTYGFHTLHGRSLPVAQGAKMANPDLTVLATGGDGDGYGIGLGHFVHAVRRNINMTYIVMDNQIYGLTKGQTSPRSAHDFVTKTTKNGNKEYPVNPLATAISNGGTFIAQSVSSDIKGLTEIIKKAIEHKGFSLVNVFSPCVTFNKVNTYDFFKEHCTVLEKPFETREEAFLAVRENEYLTGVIFEEIRDDFQTQQGIDWKILDVHEGDMNEELLRKTEKMFK